MSAGSLVLRRLAPGDERAFFEAYERADGPTTGFAYSYKPDMSFEEYLNVLHDNERGIDLPPGFVPEVMLFGVADGRIVGRLSIRLWLNEFLQRLGGHIGYIVVPEHRGRGYATEMLRQSLPIACSMGIKRALLTCDDTNVASIRTIARNGGVYEKSITGPDLSVPKRHYRIDTEAASTNQWVPVAGSATISPMSDHSPSSDLSSVPRFESPLDPVKGFLADLKELLLRPTDFFRRTPQTGGMGGPLAFALVTHWIGAALGFLWNSLAGSSVQEQMKHYLRMMQQYSDEVDTEALMNGGGNQAMEWIMGAGMVIADPFLTLLGIMIISAFVMLGAKLLVPKSEHGPSANVTYESAVRLVAYGMGPSILNGIPFVGGLVSSIYILVVTTVGAREFYRVSTGRAIVIAIFPKLILWGVIFSIIMMIVLLFFGLFSAALFS